MINEKEYYNSIKDFNNVYIKDFESIYAAYIHKKRDIKTLNLIDNIINKIFSTYGVEEIIIPYKFWDTPLGQVILNIKYNINNLENNRYYYVNDVAKILGITRQAVLKKIHANEIKANKPGREWIIPEESLYNYLKKVGQEDIMYNQEAEKIIVPEKEREVEYNTEKEK